MADITVEVEATYVPSVELLTLANQHLEFLKEVDSIAHFLHQPHVIANAMRRYENYWLPLMAHYVDRNSEDFLPPIDVHWMWHVHMLCPRQYRSDCIDCISMVPDHRFFPTKEARLKAQIKTEKMWMNFCSGELYDVDFSKIDPQLTYHKSSIQYQLASASERHLEFYYNVSLPHYSVQSFLEEAVQRYIKFINLKRLHKDASMEMCYDVALIWHGHQLSPRAYIHDTSHWLGYILNHDDTEASSTSKPALSDAQTKQLWFQLYGEPFDVPGTGYRGSDPRGKLNILPEGQQHIFQSHAVSLEVSSVEYDCLSDGVKGKLMLSTKHLKVNRFDIMSDICDKEMTLHHISPPFKWDPTNTGSLLLNPKEKLAVKIQMHEKTTSGCCFTSWTRADDISLTSAEMATYLAATNVATFSLQKDGGKVSVEATRQYLPVKFSLHELGSFQQTTRIPDDKELWTCRDIPEDSTLQMASHILKSDSGESLNVKVVHSLSLKTSVVQVFHNDKLLVVSHLIGKDQLPSSKQVEKRQCMTLDEKMGERAMVVKNNSGDFAIIKGSWTGMIPSSNDKEEVHGYLAANLLYMANGKCEQGVKVLSTGGPGQSERDTVILLDNMRINLAQGTVSMPTESVWVPEHIAVAFSILILYVLCEPSPGDKPGSDRVLNMNPSKYTLVEAAGYTADTPSNSYLWWLNQQQRQQASTSDEDDNCPCPWEAQATL